MVNFQDPSVIQADAVALDHFSHILDGIFLWEFVTTMNFEWNYVTRRRKFKWPLLLYSACRICALGGAICGLIGGDVTHKINCQQWSTWSFIFLGTAMICASTLITTRVIATWAYNRLVTAVCIVMCITNIGFLVYGVAVGRAIWSNLASKCVLDNTSQIRYNITVTAVTDVAQLFIMLVGLLRFRREKRGFIRYLYIQGLLWLLVVTIAEAPSAIFVNMNLNVPWNFMFQNFSFYTMVICATRMYRALVVYDMDSHKYSPGPKAVSSLQFGREPRKGTTTGAAPPTDRFDTSFSRTKDSEISLGEKVTSLGDEEVQLHEVPLEVPSILALENL